MLSPSPSRLRERDIRADFPGLTPGWHYLDTAATAQKPQAVIDATVAAMGRDYATVHRGVYARSADMTLAYEAALPARALHGQADCEIGRAACRERVCQYV